MEEKIADRLNAIMRGCGKIVCSTSKPMKIGEIGHDWIGGYTGELLNYFYELETD